MNQNRQFLLLMENANNNNLKKLKLDTLLMIVHHLLKEFDKKTFESSSNNDCICQEDLDFLETKIHSLKLYLEEHVITAQTLHQIFKNENHSIVTKQIAVSLEPMKAYYKYLTSLFSSKLSNGSVWLPELFAFSLLYTYKKEFGKSFTSYPFLDGFPLEKILEIFNKQNIQIKKELSKENMLPLWRVKTVQDEMYNHSEFMIKKYIDYSFKVNKRVSKTRAKRKR